MFTQAISYIVVTHAINRGKFASVNRPLKRPGRFIDRTNRFAENSITATSVTISRNWVWAPLSPGVLNPIKHCWSCFKHYIYFPILLMQPIAFKYLQYQYWSYMIPPWSCLMLPRYKKLLLVKLKVFVYCYALLLFRPVAGKVPTVLKTAEEGYLHVWLIYNLQHVHYIES